MEMKAKENPKALKDDKTMIKTKTTKIPNTF